MCVIWMCDAGECSGVFPRITRIGIVLFLSLLRRVADRLKIALSHCNCGHYGGVSHEGHKGHEVFWGIQIFKS